MRPAIHSLGRLALCASIVCFWWWLADQPLSGEMNAALIVGGLVLVYPVVWVGRRVLDRRPTPGRAVWITTLVQFGLGFLLGVPILLAIFTHRHWPGPVLPVPSGIGLVLVILTGAALLLTVANLAWKGFGAPFFIVLSHKLAADWMYAWTRNPMALAALAFFASLGIWFQSLLFVLWALVLFAPALLTFIKVYEERELELRFGASYLAYKARTPMLLPRRPKG